MISSEPEKDIYLGNRSMGPDPISTFYRYWTTTVTTLWSVMVPSLTLRHRPHVDPLGTSDPMEKISAPVNVTFPLLAWMVGGTLTFHSNGGVPQGGLSELHTVKFSLASVRVWTRLRSLSTISRH